MHIKSDLLNLYPFVQFLKSHCICSACWFKHSVSHMNIVTPVCVCVKERERGEGELKASKSRVCESESEKLQVSLPPLDDAQ